MRKHGGTPSRRDKHVTLAAISPPGVARGRFVGGQQSGLAGSKPPPLFTREASSCSSQGRRQGEPWGASPRPSAPTYLPTWGPLAAVVCGGVVAGVWCGWSLATPGGGSCVLLPATPGWASLPMVVCGSPPLLAGACWRRWCVVCGVWCVVCGVRRWCVGGVVAGVWCGWSLATPGGGSCVLLPATPGWVSLPVVVGGPRHSWLRVPGAVPRHS